MVHSTRARILPKVRRIIETTKKIRKFFLLCLVVTLLSTKRFDLPSSHFLLKRLCTKAFSYGRSLCDTSRRPPVGTHHCSTEKMLEKNGLIGIIFVPLQPKQMPTLPVTKRNVSITTRAFDIAQTIK